MALTPKQKQVQALIKQGKSVEEIAKKLNITKSGVYGHMRRIKQQPAEATTTKRPVEPSAATTSVPATGTTVTVSSSGEEIDVEGTIELAISTAQERMGILRSDIEEAQEDIERLNARCKMADDELGTLVAQIERYDSALLTVRG